jgi:UDP-glucose 4-epimerase
VTGSAGFIGSNLVTRLLQIGHTVVGYDNLSTGYKEFTSYPAREIGGQYKFIRGDLFDVGLAQAMRGCDSVFHLAANADVRHGAEHSTLDLEQNLLGTQEVLEAMRAEGIKHIVFTSTASVYGEPTIFPTPENAPMPIQTSLYGASKLAAEGLIEAYCETFGFQAHIFRLVSVLGERYSHGHVFDFYKQLKEHPDHLDILGNGRQCKSYLDVQDVISGILLGLHPWSGKVNVFNLANAGYVTVEESADCIAAYMELPSPKMNFLGHSARGWIGDSPMVNPDSTKIEALGWKRQYSISQAIQHTVEFLKENEWILNTR